jgi:arylsulfatase A
MLARFVGAVELMASSSPLASGNITHDHNRTGKRDDSFRKEDRAVMIIQIVARDVKTSDVKPFTTSGFLIRFVMLVVAILAATNSSLSASERPPNIVFILIDDMGWKDLGCTGSKYYQTPNVDRLASQGIRFENSYACAPVCSPSRGAILSGKFPGRTAFTNVFGKNTTPDDRLYRVSKSPGGKNQFLEGLHRRALPLTEVTFAEVLAEAGYKTAMFGKWHCGYEPPHRPENRGFQLAEGYRPAPTGLGHWGKDVIGSVHGLDNLELKEYVPEHLTRRAVEFIEKNKDRPFLLYLSHYIVHGPIQGKPEKVKKYQGIQPTDQDNPENAAMVESVDDSVGMVMATLDRLDLTDNTLVIFTSDNGGVSSRATSSYPLMGGKSFPYEAGMRVPLIVRWPNRVKKGQIEKTRVTGADLYPTFLDASGLPLNPKQHRDGQSLVPLLTLGEKLPKREIVVHFPHYTHATGPFASLIYDDWKLIRFYNDDAGEFELFNLETDPYEQTNLASAEPAKLSELRQRLTTWQRSADAKPPRVNPDYQAESKPQKNRLFSRSLALKERQVAEQKLARSNADR